jgi:molybdate transport system substrate-binding protein
VDHSQRRGNMHANSIFIALSMGAAIMTGQGVDVRAADIKVFSTNSPNEVLRELVPEFERSSGHKVTIIYDTPTLLFERIERGESADLIFINPNTIDDLAKQGKVVPASKRVLASISVGVAVRRGLPKPDISTVEGVKNALLAAKSIAYTQTGVSGAHMIKISRQLGIEEQIKAKAKVPTTVRLGDLLLSGEADMAVQQIPELLMIPGIDYVGPLPAELQLTTVTAVAMFANAKEPQATQALLELLVMPSTARLFKEKGMDPATQ